MQAIHEILGSKLEICAELTEAKMELLCGVKGYKSLRKGLLKCSKFGSKFGCKSGSKSCSSSGKKQVQQPE